MVWVEMLVGQTLLEFLYFKLVLLDFVLFLDQQLLKRLRLLSKLLLFVVGTVLVLDGLLELCLKDYQFVQGFVLLLFYVSNVFVCSSQLFVDPFQLLAHFLALLLLSLQLCLQLFALR